MGSARLRKMRNVFGILLALGWLLAGQGSRAGESARDYAVEVTAQVQACPSEIRLHWEAENSGAPTGYSLYRKSPGDNSWGPEVCLPATATGYVDHQVRVGTTYEYQVVRHATQYSAYGYLCSGSEVLMTEHRGTLLLVVDKTFAPDLAGELTQLEQDLTGDGWRVTRLEVNRNDSPTAVKQLICAQYRAAPAEVKCVFLFGHVPVPYSGNIMPDGHGPAHQGAWPCDGYYGDMEGRWTDDSVNETRATHPRNRNVPGDGKFDQNSFPAPLKLMVGRVDLANLPGRWFYGGPATFPSELELLRNYLHKDHLFRTGQLELPRRAVLADYFGTHNGEAFAASGWRNLSALLGPGQIESLTTPGTWVQTLSQTPCLWAYGCGPGTFESIAGLGHIGPQHSGTSYELVHQDIKAAFVLLYGSWQADWDAADDVLRAVLAAPSCGLACASSGRPHWFLHPMGLGETIGFATRLTQNNGRSGPYHTQVNTAAGQIHIALMGDPTLRLFNVAPPSHLVCAAEPEGMALRWRASREPVLGYHVYRAEQSSGPFARLTPSPLPTTSYTDAHPERGATYMVRAVKLETSPSGTFYNLSQATFAPSPTPESLGRAALAVARPGMPRDF